MFGWQNDSVFEKCIGCRCTRLLSEEMFIYTLFIFLSCSDEVDENLESILTCLSDMAWSSWGLYGVYCALLHWMCSERRLQSEERDRAAGYRVAIHHRGWNLGNLGFWLSFYKATNFCDGLWITNLPHTFRRFRLIAWVGPFKYLKLLSYSRWMITHQYNIKVHILCKQKPLKCTKYVHTLGYIQEYVCTSKSKLSRKSLFTSVRIIEEEYRVVRWERDIS